MQAYGVLSILWKTRPWGGPTIEDRGPTSGIKYAMIHHHKINTLALWLARPSLRPPSHAILEKGPYQLSSSVVLPHGFPLFCRLQRAVVPCLRQVYHHREGSVPTLKLSRTTPWVFTALPSSTRRCPMSPTSVTSCPRWILSNTSCPRWILSNTDG